MSGPYGHEYEDLRQRAKAFCQSSWPLTGDEAALPHRRQVIVWQKRAIEAGLLHRSFPREYGGGGLPQDLRADMVIKREFAQSDVPYLESTPNGPMFLVPALLECGTEEQKATYIAPTLSGEMDSVPGVQRTQCRQRPRLRLTSRAALTPMAGRVINGQKSGGYEQTATPHDMMFEGALFRTELTGRRHPGRLFLMSPDGHAAARRRVHQRRSVHGVCENILRVCFRRRPDPRRETILGPAGGLRCQRYQRAYLKTSGSDWLAVTSVFQRPFAHLVNLAGRTAETMNPAIVDTDIRQPPDPLRSLV